VDIRVSVGIVSPPWHACAGPAIARVNELVPHRLADQIVD